MSDPQSTLARPTQKALRTEAKRLGITAGIDALVEQAAAHPDPLGFLAIHAAPPQQPPAEAAAAAIDAAGDADESAAQAAAADAPPADPPPPPAFVPHRKRVQDVAIRGVPLHPLPQELIAAQRYHLSTHVDVQLKTEPQRWALRELTIGLDQRGARTADGKRVLTAADAVRWLLEQLPSASNPL